MKALYVCMMLYSTIHFVILSRRVFAAALSVCRSNLVLCLRTKQTLGIENICFMFSALPTYQMTQYIFMARTHEHIHIKCGDMEHRARTSVTMKTTWRAPLSTVFSTIFITRHFFFVSISFPCCFDSLCL